MKVFNFDLHSHKMMEAKVEKLRGIISRNNIDNFVDSENKIINAYNKSNAQFIDFPFDTLQEIVSSSENEKETINGIEKQFRHFYSNCNNASEILIKSFEDSGVVIKKVSVDS